MAFKQHTASRSPFLISTDQSLLDIDAIHGFLSTCYWSPGITRSRLDRAIRNSLCFGVYDTGKPRPIAAAEPASFLDSVELPDESESSLPSLVGFARIITDAATYAYLCDVFILESHRGRGLSKWLMKTILAHPDLQGLRRFCLMTKDAHGLYAQHGFAPMADPSRYMEILDRESYKRG